MNYEKIISTSKDFFRELENLEDRAVAWVNRKFKLDKVFKKKHGPYMDKMTDFPEGWAQMMILGYYFSRVFFDPENLKKFFRAHKEDLSPGEEKMVSVWKKNPPVWSLFTVEAEEHPGFYRIRDILTEETRLLYSPGVRGRLRETGHREAPFLCALLYNGECWSTYGIIRGYLGLTGEDFRFLVSFMDSRLFDAQGLNGIINEYYARFFTIDRVMEIPGVVFQGEPLEICWTETVLEDFSPGNYPDLFKAVEEAGEYFHCVGKNRGPGPPEFELFINTADGNALLFANTRSSYSRLTESLMPDYSLSGEPEAAVSMTLTIVMERDMDYMLPYTRWMELFGKDEKDGAADEDDSLARMNELLRGMTEAENTGAKFDAEAECERLGLDPAVVPQIRQMFEKMHKRSAVPDVEGGVDYPVPPPAVRRHFIEGLKKSTIFTLDAGPGSYRLFQELKDDDFEDEDYAYIPDILEDAFVEEFDSYGLTVMNTFIYILCHAGKRWVLLKDVAAEIIKLFGHVILPGLDMSAKDFIHDLSTVIRIDLVPLGLIDIETEPAEATMRKGQYNIKASAFFLAYIGLK